VIVKKKPRMGSKIAKIFTTIENCESFFTFFNPPHIPENEDDLDDDAVRSASLCTRKAM
jgi:nucleosome assembly protein 1-like 1